MFYISCFFQCMLLPQERSDRTCINCFHNSLCAKYPGILFSVFLIFTRKESITIRSDGKTICTTKTHLKTIVINQKVWILTCIEWYLKWSSGDYEQLNNLKHNMKSNFIQLKLITLIPWYLYFLLKIFGTSNFTKQLLPGTTSPFFIPLSFTTLMTAICNPFLFMPKCKTM